MRKDLAWSAAMAVVLAVWSLSPAGAAPASAPAATAPASAAAPQERTAPASAVPKDLPDDSTVWPNRTCYRRSEPWLVANHAKLRKMLPRVLVLNFANDVDMDGIRLRTEKYLKARAETTRYHGFADANAPAFVEYQVAKYVDLRDTPVPAERAKANSGLFPVLPKGKAWHQIDYHALYNDRFAERYGFADPSRPGKFLNLHQLIDAGIVHELWLYLIHNEGWPALEVAEIKQYYDAKGQPIPGRHGPAGNGDGPDTLPWSGRTFTVYFFNPHRGVGCALENYGHLLEGYANHDAIGYLTPYFREYAALDLNKRFGLPLRSFYELSGQNAAAYGQDGSVTFTVHGKECKMEKYVANGGNVHFPPGARHHYDMGSPATVPSTIENYRLRNGPDGKDKVAPFNIQATKRYRDTAPDCMGSWVVYWCQGMPGLGNKCVDDAGSPMKNWWVYLFY